VWGRGEAYTGKWWGNLWERNHLEDPEVCGGENMKLDLQEMGCEGIDWIRLA